MSTEDTSASSRPETARGSSGRPRARSGRSSPAAVLLLLAAVCLAVAGAVALQAGPRRMAGATRAPVAHVPGSSGVPGAGGAGGSDSPAAGAGSPLFAIPAERYVPLGTMRIPKIGVETPFYPGVHDEVVALGPGLWPGTPLPGSPGNAVFAGHRTTHTHPFRDLDKLAPGDVIETATGSAAPVEFEVVATTVVPEAQYVDFVLRQPADPGERRITLFACAAKGRRTHRIVVQATAAGAGSERPGSTAAAAGSERPGSPAGNEGAVGAGAPAPAEGRDAVRPNAA